MPPQRIALTGVSGFIGSVIARQLHEQNYAVTGLVRETSRRDHIEPFVDRFVVGEQHDESAWSDFLDGADAVIHNSVDWKCLKEKDYERHVQSNIVGTLKLLEASAPRPFIFMSTVAVHHDMRPRWNGQIDEDHPLRPGNLYGAYKAAIEPHLWRDHYENDRHVAAIRPCAVYGMDTDLKRSIGYPIIQKIARKESFDRKGGGKFIHVEDVAAATIAALENFSSGDASGRAFNMADCYARWADWAKIAADLLEVDADIDFSSPESSKNTFTKDAVQNTLGIEMDRHFGGIREHLRELIDRMRSEGALD